MKWTTKNYPDAMKHLPVGVRNKAIKIANAISNANAKMKDGLLIATAIMHALKNTVVKKEKKVESKINTIKKKVMDKKKSAKKKAAPAKKASAKKSAARKVAIAKKAGSSKKASAGKKSSAKKAVSKKKVDVKKALPKKKAVAVKKALPKKMASAEKTVTRKKEPAKKTKSPAAKPKQVKATQDKVQKTPVETLTPEIANHHEDLHLIPEKNVSHPVNAFEAHKIENIFHHNEEVALHQENQKAQQAMTARKNAKNVYRSRGRR